MARKQVCEAVKAGGYGHREIVIRINGLDTAWGAATLLPRLPRRPTRCCCPSRGRGADMRE